ncbi:MAG: CaiB/BaiF CoA-transferase family protein [Chryseolinea sp.]
MFEALRILELSSVLAGPAVGQFFAELGARVVKVENASSDGDVTRCWKKKGENTDDISAYFSAVNWGKKSLCVNLYTKAGRDIIHSLARVTDVVIASYKPGDAKRLGVDYGTLRVINPKIIYGQITGYGSHDPRVGYDAVIQAEAGFMFMNGAPGGPSLKMPVAMIDILAAHQLKEGILVALLKNAHVQQSIFVEVSLLQVAISSLANQATNWLVGNEIPQKQGSEHPNIAPYGDVFTTRSGDEIILAIGTDKQFQVMCERLNIIALAADERFRGNSDRLNNRAALKDLLQEVIVAHETDSIVGLLQSSLVPAGAIRNLEKVFELDAAKDILLHSGQLTGVRTYVGSPLAHIPSHFLPPPHLGQHTFEILSEELGFDKDAVQKLFLDGTVR